MSMPLSLVSAQPAFVHYTWPITMCRNIMRLTTYESDAALVLRVLSRRIAQSLTPTLWPEPDEMLSKPSCSRTIKPPSSSTLWIPMCFNNRLKPVLARTLRDFLYRNKEMTGRALAEFNLTDVRLAWANSGTQLRYILRRPGTQAGGR